MQSSRARKNEANYHEPTGSDDGVDKSDSDDDVSLRSESSNPPQLARSESDQLEMNLDDHMAGGLQSNNGDMDRRTKEDGAQVAVDSGKSAELPKLYLFSGGGFCVPDEEDEVSGLHVPDRIQPVLHGDLNEGQSNGVGSSQRSTGDPVSTSAGLQTEDLELATEIQSTTGLKIADLLAAGEDDMTSARVDPSVGSGLRAMPFLRRKQPSKQP